MRRHPSPSGFFGATPVFGRAEFAPAVGRHTGDRAVTELLKCHLGTYNWGMQPGLKDLTDHFLEAWFWRPATIASYSAGRLSGTRSSYAWHNTLSEMGMVVISSTLTVGPILQTLDEAGEPIGDPGAALERAFARFADDLAWRTEAAKAQRARRAPPY